ncbi:DUF2511 domain-containing protein [Mycobacterium sp. GA-1199]|uniref:DUF2511 domain-containing protein n=1 Tax=Mycobacterium sp. GA-1199 TaxID=1772287 RepID=UPI001E60C62D|nr:DUF2511 domain-containing protein [Mycobacterium sp. GA-1199]
MITAMVGALAMMMMIGCGSNSDTAATTQASPPSMLAQSPSSSTASAAPTPQGPPPGYVSRATWTDGPWPLTIDEAVLECQGDNLVTIAVGESKYALNAAAMRTGLPDYADEIGAPDPAKPGAHIDARTLIEKGLALCGAGTTPSAPSGDSNRPAGLVERATWTEGPWPFTVDSATLMCTKGAGGERVTVVADREMYALNGTARAANLWPPFDPIWRDDPNAPGVKVDIGPMIDRGLALCGG